VKIKISLLFSSSLHLVFSLFRSCSLRMAPRSSDQQPGRGASERGADLLAPEQPIFCSFEGRVFTLFQPLPSPPLTSVFAKNLDAERRNEEPIFCSPRTGPRSGTTTRWNRGKRYEVRGKKTKISLSSSRAFSLSCSSRRTAKDQGLLFVLQLLPDPRPQSPYPALRLLRS